MTDTRPAKRPRQKVRGSTSGRPLMLLLDVLGQRWTLRVLWELRDGRQSFRALRERCDAVSPTVLSQRLKQLRELGLIDLAGDGYGMTGDGAELGKMLAQLDIWAERWAEARGGEASAAP